MRVVIFFVIIPLIYLISLPVLLIVYLVSLVNKDISVPIAYGFNRFIGFLLFMISGAKFDSIGVEYLKSDGPVIYVANHRSMLDIVLLTKYQSKPMYFIGKKSVSKWPVVGWWISASGTVFIDRTSIRDGARAIKAALKLIDEGKSIALFPEGTRSKNGEILDFKVGTFKLASRSKVPMIPIAVKGTDDVFENNGIGLRNEMIHMRVGEPIIYDQLDSEKQKNLASYVREEIIRLYNTID